MVSAEHPIEPTPSFAIIGYAARFPGAASAEEYWALLRDGREAISDVPKDRWDIEEFFDPDRRHRARSSRAARGSSMT